MSYSISDVESDLESVLHGTTTNQITNLFGLFDRAARQLLLDIDPQETKRITQFTGPIFNNIYDYGLAADVKGNTIIDIRPQVNRLPSDIFVQQYNQAFDIWKQNYMSNADSFTINFNTAVKTIRIDAPFLLPPVITNAAEGITLNGTWTTGGNAAALTADNQNYVYGGGSLQFNLSATGVPGSTGYLENSTMNATNLTAHLNQATEFLWSYLPSGSKVSNVEFRWGSSASNYYVLNATQTQQQTAFQNGWNLLSFLWSSAAAVGTPNPASITYMRVTWTYDGTLQTGVRLNYIQSILGNVMEYEYYSKYLFRSASTGAFQETVDDVSNLINLDTESYNLYFNQVAYLAVQQTQGIDASFHDGPFFLQLYTEGVNRYKGRYKSELQKPQSIFYRKPNKSYLGYFRRWNGN